MLPKMNFLYEVVLVLYLTRAVFANQSEEELCATVTKINCQNNYASKEDEMICADNGETYMNRCFFVQAKCHDKNIDIVCHGNCTQCAKSDPIEETTKGPPIPQELSLTKLPDCYTQTTTESGLDRIQRQELNQSTNSTETGTDHGRRLQQQTTAVNKNGKKLTTGQFTTMASFEERFYNLTGLNITRTRKYPPGHHVDQSTDTTTKSNPKPSCMGGRCGSDTMEGNENAPCTKGNCSKRDTININCSSHNCSEHTTTTTTSPSKQSLLVTLLLRTTRKCSSHTTPTLLKIISTTSRHTEAVYSTGTVPTTEFDLVSFCLHVDTKVCPKTLDPLCGTDNKFYLNICTFNKEKCKDKSLQIQSDLSICRQKSS